MHRNVWVAPVLAMLVPAGWPAGPVAAQPWTFEGVPGWLGLAAVRPGTRPAYLWSPRHPAASAVVLDGIEGVSPGAKLQVTSRTGTTSETYEGTFELPYGCEKNTARMAVFDGSAALPEGPVWILPSGPIAAKPVPVEEIAYRRVPARMRAANGARAQEGIAFRVGGRVLVVVEKTGRYRATLTAYVGEKKVASQLLERQHMGDDEEEFHLTSGERIQVPVPVAAFEIAPDGRVAVVLWSLGYEGNSFGLLEVRGESGVVRPGPSYYFCAY